MTASLLTPLHTNKCFSSTVTLLRSLLFPLSTYTVPFLFNILYLYISVDDHWENFLNTVMKSTEFE